MMRVTPADYAQFAAEIGLDVAGANCGVGPAELLDSTQGLIAAGIEIPLVEKGTAVFRSMSTGRFISAAARN